MIQGYIKLWRRLKDSDIWLKEKFTRGQAWVDLLMLANHREGFIRKRGIRIDLQRGDIGWSERELAKRWKWSRDKVRRFLNELCSENESKMIPQNQPQNKNITSCYHILNYSLYQGNNTTEKTANKTTNRPQTDRKQDQNKNEKNEKKKDIYGEYVALTKEEHSRLIEDYGSNQLQRMIEELNNYFGANEKRLKKYTSHNHVLRGWVADKLGIKKLDRQNYLSNQKNFKYVDEVVKEIENS